MFDRTIARASTWANNQSRLLMLAAIVLLWISTYFFPNRIALFPRHPAPALPGEAGWPFWEWTVVVYLSVAGQLLIAVNWTRHAFGRVWVGVAGLLIIHTIIFWLYPTEYPRPYNPATLALPWSFVYGLMVSIDQPHNCFPSLHVAIPLLVGLVVWRDICRRRGAILIVWALVVAVSIVTTKQHTTGDALGGIFTGTLLAWYLTQKPLSH